MAGTNEQFLNSIHALRIEIDSCTRSLQSKLSAIENLSFDVISKVSSIDQPESECSSALPEGAAETPKHYPLCKRLQEPAALAAYTPENMHSDSQLNQGNFFSRSTSSHQDDRGLSSLHMRGSWLALSTMAGASALDDLEKNNRKSVVKQRNTAGPNKRRQSIIVTAGVGLVASTGVKLCEPLHPHSSFRLAWDSFSLGLLLCDGVLLPIFLAWQVDVGTETASGSLALFSAWFSLFYWSCDVIASFNTGVFIKGNLVLDRVAIAHQYIHSWLIFDLGLIAVDLMQMVLDSMPQLRFLRFLRLMRATRMLRLLKMGRLSTIIEERAATGQPWIILAIAVSKTCLVMLFAAHWLTCIWCWIGRILDESGSISWLQVAQAQEVPGWVQYLHSLRWIVNSPSPAPIHAGNGLERFWDIASQILTLFVMGSALTTITGKMTELHDSRAEALARRRGVRTFLNAQHCPFELVARIMRFVDYRLDKIENAKLDVALISPTLQTELYVSQRGAYLGVMPIFALAQETFPDIFAAVCAKLCKLTFEVDEPVFTFGLFAKGLYITSSGTFSHREGLDDPDCIGPGSLLTGIHACGEISLYVEGYLHQSSLAAVSFAECLMLTGEDLADCVRESPTCICMFCEYAKSFVSLVKAMKEPPGLSGMWSMADRCCKQNEVYQMLYPDPKTQLTKVDIPARSHGTVSVLELSSKVLNGNEYENLAQTLEETLPELDPLNGPHIIFGQPVERDRALSSCLSIIALAADRYDIFTAPQSSDTKLSQKDWNSLRAIVAWAHPTAESLAAVVVLLAIRALGKSSVLLRQVPPDAKRPEQAVFFLMGTAGNIIPSCGELSDEAIGYVREALAIHEFFNLAQMLQGENVPGNLHQLQDCVQTKGETALKIYILFLLGLMAGLAGGRGSRFMNAKNAIGVVTGIQFLQHILESTPRAIYWSYLVKRGEQLFLPAACTPEDLVLTRLACLGRVQDEMDAKALRVALDRLSPSGRQVLVKHFLADGITERAFLLEFLPACMANAKSNDMVGIPILLDVLVNLISAMQQAAEPANNPSAHMLLTVDLSDMAAFIEAVQNRFVFHTCISRCRFRFRQARVTVELTRANWARIHDRDSDTTLLAYDMHELLQRQQNTDKMLSKIARNVQIGRLDPPPEFPGITSEMV